MGTFVVIEAVVGIPEAEGYIGEASVGRGVTQASLAGHTIRFRTMNRSILCGVCEATLCAAGLIHASGQNAP